jgi:hypothetical protein
LHAPCPLMSISQKHVMCVRACHVSFARARKSACIALPPIPPSLQARPDKLWASKGAGIHARDTALAPLCHRGALLATSAPSQITR